MENKALFDVNKTDFNDKNKQLWYLGKNIVPLEISLENIMDNETREGCAQIYFLTKKIISDMYMNPGLYPFQTFDLLFNSFIRCGAVIDGNCWLVPFKTYKKYINHFGDFQAVQDKYGFKAEDVGENIRLTNLEYPLFLKYWYPLFKLSQKRGVSVLSCDFRLLSKKYKLTAEDFIRTQPDRIKPFFAELGEYAVSKGAKLITSFRYRKYRYFYKKECVLIFEDVNFCPCAVVPYNNQYSKKQDPWAAFEIFAAEAEKQPDSEKLIDFIRKKICLCTACSNRKDGAKSENERCGHLLDIHGERLIASSCHNELCLLLDEKSGQKDIALMKRMIDLRIAQADVMNT